MMTKDEIISNLMEQLKATNRQIAAQSAHIADITARLNEALARLESIEESVKKKDETIRKEKNRNKGMSKLLEKENERQKPPKPEITEEELRIIVSVSDFPHCSIVLYFLPLRPCINDIQL